MNLKSVVATRDILYKYLKGSHYPLVNPDLILKTTGNNLSVYRDLLYDSHVYSCIQSRRSGVKSLKWCINRGQTVTTISRIINEIFDNLNLPALFNDILDATLFGYSIIEIYWQYLDGLIKPIRLIQKPQEWFFTDKNNIWYFNLGNEPVTLPPKKFFVVTHNATYDNPYGEALLSKCYFPVFYKKEIVKLWATFTEKYGMPFIVAKAPIGSSKEEITALHNKLEELRQDGVLAIEGEDINIEILDASKSSSPDLFQKFIHFFNAEVSKAILSQTLTTEQGDTGSYAMAQTHFDVRKDVVDADKRLVEFWINELIKWIIEFNFPDQKPPVFELYSEEDVDLTLADRDTKLAGTGQIRFTKEYWSKAYGFDENDFFTVEPQTFSEHQHAEIDTGLNNLSEATKDIIAVILAMINESKSLDEIEKKLFELFPNLNTEEIENLIEKSIIISEIQGRLSAKV